MFSICTNVSCFLEAKKERRDEEQTKTRNNDTVTKRAHEQRVTTTEEQPWNVHYRIYPKYSDTSTPYHTCSKI